MKHEWFSAEQIAAARAEDLPATVQGINKLAEREGWRCDPEKARTIAGRGRPRWEYHVSLLPAAVQMRLALMHCEGSDAAEDASTGLWQRYERLSKRAKAECARRLKVIDKAEEYRRTGLSETAAVGAAAHETGVSPATVWNWRSQIAGIARSDWLAALAPAYRSASQSAECHPHAWDVLASDYLRPERPSFSACYRRMKQAAKANGWSPVPGERSLRRRLKKEIPDSVVTLARSGADKAKTLYPAQRRSRAGLHAMQAVNSDGHKLDVFVQLPDSDKPVRLLLLALQDLYSGKIVAWRLAQSENKVAVRLAIGDMVEAYGIPDIVVLDNGRAFASKWITGGIPNRFRFKVRDEDPQGLLKTLGCEVHWTKPYSGQSKPIERAFRDLAEEIAKHPVCAGAYVGNSPDAKPENYGSRAIPLETFRAHVDHMIAEHNARPGRNTETANGRSFDETFQESYSEAIIRFPTAAQKSLWLLAAERVTAQRGSGEIRLFGNRYWAPEMNAHAGRKVTVRFDPDRLQQPISVYTADDKLICSAECVADTGFFDAEAAQKHGRDRAAWQRAQRDQLRLQRTLTAAELADIYGATPEPSAPAHEPPKIKRLAVGGSRVIAAAQEDFEAIDDNEFEARFSKGLRLISGGEPDDL